jgi:hypothetical protein
MTEDRSHFLEFLFSLGSQVTTTPAFGAKLLYFGMTLQVIAQTFSHQFALNDNL